VLIEMHHHSGDTSARHMLQTSGGVTEVDSINVEGAVTFTSGQNAA
jgi:hypothetical protein